MWVIMKRSGIPLSSQERMQDHLRFSTCLFDAMKRLGPEACQTSPKVPPVFAERGIREVAERAASRLGMDVSTVVRTLTGTYCAWLGHCRVNKHAWHFTAFLNRCELGEQGDVENLCVRNDDYSKWAPNMDHPIGPLGRGDEYGGMREIPVEFAEVPAASIDLTNHFELDPQTLRYLPMDLLALNLTNMELGPGRSLPSDLATRFPGLLSVSLAYNPHGWREALQCLPRTVKWLDLSHCGVAALPGELSRWFPQLEHLVLSGNPNVLNHPLPHVPSLRRLILSCCEGVDGRTLHEVDSDIRSDELLLLGPLPGDLGTTFPQLEEINLGGNKNFPLTQLSRLPERVVTVCVRALTGSFPTARADGKPFTIAQLSLEFSRISGEQLMTLPPSLERMDGYLFAPPEERVPAEQGASCLKADGWRKGRDSNGRDWFIRTPPYELPVGFAERFTRLIHFRVGRCTNFDITSLARLPPSLRSVEMENNSLCEVPDIFDAHLSHVEVVNIGGNPINPRTLLRLPPALRKLDCSGGPNHGDSFPGFFAFPAGFSERCPVLEELRIYYHQQLDLKSLRNLPPTLKRLSLPSCAGPLQQFPNDALVWFPALEILDLAGSGFLPSAGMRKHAAAGRLRLRLP